MEAAGPGSGGAGFRQLDAQMRSYAASLRAAGAAATKASHRVKSRDGAVAVTVDGRPRVTEFYIGLRAIKQGPQKLAAAVTETVNQALRIVQRGGQEALLTAVEPPLRDGPGASGEKAVSNPEAKLAELSEMLQSHPLQRAAVIDAAAALAARRVTGTSGDGQVTATATGRGELTGIGFSATALRGLDNTVIGNRVAQAVNAALEAAGRLQDQQRQALTTDGGRARFAAAADEVVDQLSHQMEGLLRRLDEVSRSLDSLDEDIASSVREITRELGESAG